jgi:hypothetical protein
VACGGGWLAAIFFFFIFLFSIFYFLFSGNQFIRAGHGVTRLYRCFRNLPLQIIFTGRPITAPTNHIFTCEK